MVAGLAFAPWSPVAAQGEPSSYDAALEAEAAVRRAHDEAQARAQALAGEVAALDERVGDGEHELATAEADLLVAHDRSAQADARLADTERRLEVERARLREQSILAYIGGGATPVPNLARALGSAEAMGDLAKTRVYAAAVVEDRRRLISEVNGLVDQVALHRDEARQAREAAQAARDEVAARVGDLIARRDERAASQQAAEQAAADAAARATELEVRRQAEEQRYAELHVRSDDIATTLQARQQDQVLPASTYGIFLNPVLGGRVVSGYGARLHPILNEDKLHTGLDIDGAMGTPLRASADGVVVSADERGGYGLAVVIDHGNRLATVYAHMSAFAVQAGDEVRAGDVIGAVGSTGMSTGPHCHWEVRVDGLPVDGTPYLRPADPPT